MSDVDVIIPVHNRQTVILDTLASVQRQTRLPNRLIVVDDGSTDQTPASVQRWVADERPPFEVSVLRKEKRSAAAARRDGFEHVEANSMVAFLDSDDIWPVDFLQRTTAALQADRDAVAVSVDRQFCHAGGDWGQFDDCRALAHDPIPWLFRHGAGIASCTLLRATAVMAAGNWDPLLEVAEDTKLFAEVALHGRWLHTPGAPVVFGHGNSAQRNEESNLGTLHRDSCQRWAITHEQTFRSLEGRYPEHRRQRLRPLLANYWNMAGKQLQTMGRRNEAFDCYRRALDWYPMLIKARIRMYRIAANPFMTPR